MFSGLLGNLFWVAIGMALMFGLWFGALSLWPIGRMADKFGVTWMIMVNK